MAVPVTRVPSLFAAHGGGPLPLLGDASHAALTHWFKTWPKTALKSKPKAILVVSAHWEEPVATVTSSPQPELIYDYYGFPPESYSIQYPAPGSPDLAARVVQLLTAAGVAARTDATRGWDHGVYVPLKLMFPEATIPVVELSLLSSLDPEAHIRMGEALAPLKDEGVLLVGSGFSFHNLRAFVRADSPASHEVTERSKRFDTWLANAVAGGGHSWQERRQLLAAWEKAPEARYCHPREEHLLPLMVAFGAGKGDEGRVVWSDTVMNAWSSSVQWG